MKRVVMRHVMLSLCILSIVAGAYAEDTAWSQIGTQGVSEHSEESYDASYCCDTTEDTYVNKKSAYVLSVLVPLIDRITNKMMYNQTNLGTGTKVFLAMLKSSCISTAFQQWLSSLRMEKDQKYTLKKFSAIVGPIMQVFDGVCKGLLYIDKKSEHSNIRRSMIPIEAERNKAIKAENPDSFAIADWGTFGETRPSSKTKSLHIDTLSDRYHDKKKEEERCLGELKEFEEHVDEDLGIAAYSLLGYLIGAVISIPGEVCQ